MKRKMMRKREKDERNEQERGRNRTMSCHQQIALSLEDLPTRTTTTLHVNIYTLQMSFSRHRTVIHHFHLPEEPSGSCMQSMKAAG